MALNFVNTADWSSDGQVTHEKNKDETDLQLWLGALQLNRVSIGQDVADLLSFRSSLRLLLLGFGDPASLNVVRNISIANNPPGLSIVTGQCLKPLLAVSALSILADHRELSRLRICPGDNCGWLFIDETKNARRTWCSMETCGNRAKAARHYRRHKRSGDALDA